MASGSIRKQTSSKGVVTYQICIEYGTDPVTGKRVRSYHKFHGNKKQAEAELRRMLTDLDSGRPISLSSMLLSSWMDQWLSMYLPNIEETTRAGYSEKIKNHIKPYLGAYPLNALRADVIQKWINDLTAKGLSPKSVKHAYQLVKAALEKAVILQMIMFNPCKGTTLPKMQKPQTNVYNKNEVDAMLRAAQGTDMYLPLLLLVTLGLRRGELAGLKWSNVDLSNRTIKVCDTIVTVNGKPLAKPPKSAAGIRTLHIGQDLTDILAEAKRNDYMLMLQRKLCCCDYVVHMENGLPYNPDVLTRKWTRFKQMHGLKDIRLHDLRHSCATLMIQAGIDPKTVQHRLGHADISITLNTYTHCTPQMDANAADKMDDIIFSVA